MVEVTTGEPQTAAEYEDRTTRAVKSVLVEIGQVLGSFKGRFAVIGGAVPWLLIESEEMPHVGTIDLDLTLDAEALAEDAEYADLVQALMDAGYEQRQDHRRFQLVRKVEMNEGPPIEVVVDFLMPRNAEVVKNKPPIISEFAVQKADGADLALQFYKMVAVEGPMPDGGRNRVEVAVASIPALLVMKGFAIGNRKKRKDAYDIYYCVRNFPGGHEALAEACRPLLEVEGGPEGFARIAAKFEAFDTFGPTSVRIFMEEGGLLGDLTPAELQQDAFGQVDAWLKALGLRS